MKVSAQDDDLGISGQVEYSMGSDGALFFDIDSQTGKITTKEGAEFDRENPDSQAILASGEVTTHTCTVQKPHCITKNICS